MKKLALAYYNSMLNEVKNGATIVGGLSWEKAKELAKHKMINHNSKVSLETPEIIGVVNYRAGIFNL